MVLFVCRSNNRFDSTVSAADGARSGDPVVAYAGMMDLQRQIVDLVDQTAHAMPIEQQSHWRMLVNTERSRLIALERQFIVSDV